MNLQTLKANALENSEFKKEYDALDEEFQLINTLLKMRLESGLTQQEIAEKMGTKPSNISRLEKGTGNPTIKTLQKYAHVCGFEFTLGFRPSH